MWLLNQLGELFGFIVLCAAAGMLGAWLLDFPPPDNPEGLAKLIKDLSEDRDAHN